MTPQLHYLKLSESNAKGDFSSSEGFALHTEKGRIIGQIKYPRTQQVFAHAEPSQISKPDWAIQHALNAVCVFDSAMLRIEQDQRFTIDGKRERIAPVSENAIKTISAVHKELRNYAADNTNATLQHYAVPAFDPADMMGFLREQEIRTWIHALGDKAKMKLVQPLTEGSNPYVSLAVLRSPIPFENLQEDAQAGWRVVRDKADPETAGRIAGAAELIEWASPYVQVTADIVRKSSLEIIKPDQFALLVPAEARELFGLRKAA